MNDKQYRKLSDRYKQDYNHPEYALKLDYQILFNLSDRDINQLHRYFSPHRIVNGLNKREIKEFVFKQDLTDKGFSEKDIEKIYSKKFKEEDRQTAIDLLSI